MSADLVEVRDALVRLRGSVESLRSAGGDSPYIRRLMNDLDRFQVDMEDLPGAGLPVTAVRRVQGAAREMVPVPVVHDGRHPHAPWPDADDEGIGGHRR
ncbi:MULTISPECIES: hypothetical protein [unclassified Streptomyces]|uniref:hypothetical protein n=1 Tax=unclassified Streptomyces TaxID=2593676 RepID=UPI0040417A2E